MDYHPLGHVFRQQTVSGNAQVHNGDQYKITRIEAAARPKPRSLVPFHRDPDFVGREEFLVLLDHALDEKAGHKRAALTGLGGMGKSQIAIELSWRYSSAHPNHWVFWVFASNRNRFTQSFIDIAYAVGLELNGSSTDILRNVRSWLSDPLNGSWLMIVDNADSYDDFCGDDSAGAYGLDNIPLAEYLPQAAHGYMLITSRNYQIGEQLAGSAEATFRISEFDLQTACILISRKLDVSATGPCGQTERLAQSLDCIPLAITQATAYIRAQQPRMDIGKYVSLFERSIVEQQRLLSTKWADIRRDTSVSNAILTTWLLSYNHIKNSTSGQQTCEPTRILLLLSLIDRQSIDESLVRPDDANQMEFGESLAVLHQYSMVRQLPDGTIYQHRLLHIAARIWLEAEPDPSSYKVQMYTSLVRALGAFYIGQATWQQAESLLSHLRESASWILSDELYTEGELGVAEICGVIANFCSVLRRPFVSLAWRKIRLEVLEKTQGPHHIDTLSTLSEYAVQLVQVGRFNEARQILLTSSWMSLASVRHIQVLNIALKLGQVASRLGMHKLALDFSLKVMRQSRRKSFEVHYSNERWDVEREAIEFVATLYISQGNLDPAEWLLQNLLRRIEAREIPQETEKLSAIKLLVLIVGESLGRQVEQENLLRQLNSICVTLSQDNNIECIRAANAYIDVGDGFAGKLRLASAESLYIKAHSLLSRIHGQESPKLATALAKLSTVYTLQQDFQLAEHWHHRALRVMSLATGDEISPDTFSRIHILQQWRDTSQDLALNKEWDETSAKTMESHQCRLAQAARERALVYIGFDNFFPMFC